MKFSKSIAACKACGRAFIKVRKGHLFCCVECQRATWKEKGKEEVPPERLCRFNPGVKCLPTGRTCQTCGWDPQIAKARLRRIRRELRKSVHDI